MEKKRKLYAKERSAAKLIYGIGIGMFVYGVFVSQILHHSWEGNEAVPEIIVRVWFLSIIPFLLILIYCIKAGNVVGRESSNYIRWRNYLTKNGIWHQGAIVGFREVGVYRSGNKEKNNYCYSIRYFSELRREEITFETPALAFDPYKKDYRYCTVYEVEEKAPWALPFQDATDSVIGISDNKIQFSLSPFKLWKAIDTKSRQNWFGSYVAVDFR